MSDTLDTLATIRTRYACRAFADTPVPADVLHTIAEAGLHSPSAVNRQPWRILAVTNPEAIARLDAAGLAALKANDPAFFERIQGRGGKLLYNAPAVVIVAQAEGDAAFSPALDVGIVAAHIALAATSLGVDSCIAALPGHAFRGPDGPELNRLFQMPDGFGFGVAILLGYAAGAPGRQHDIDPAKLIAVN
jgi:nitroreductase